MALALAIAHIQTSASGLHLRWAAAGRLQELATLAAAAQIPRAVLILRLARAQFRRACTRQTKTVQRGPSQCTSQFQSWRPISAMSRNNVCAALRRLENSLAHRKLANCADCAHSSITPTTTQNTDNNNCPGLAQQNSKTWSFVETTTTTTSGRKLVKVAKRQHWRTALFANTPVPNLYARRLAPLTSFARMARRDQRNTQAAK